MRIPSFIANPAGRAFAALLFVVALGVTFNADGAFFTLDTHTEMLRHVSRFGIIACGMTLVIIAGGIDLAVGSVLGLSAVFFALFTIHWGWSGWLALPACLLVGGLAGFCSGVLIAKVKIQPFVATLAMMVFARGLAKVVSGGQKISTAVKGADGSFTYIDAPSSFDILTARLLYGNIFTVTLLFLGCIAIVYILLRRLRVGRHLYAIGGNEESARLSGINVFRAKVTAYIASGVLAALAGVCQAADEMQGDPEAGQTYELTAIAIVVIGGTNLMGGRGGIMLTLLGTLTIGYLEKILSINAISDAHRLIITGVIIVCAVILQRPIRSKREILSVSRFRLLTVSFLLIGTLGMFGLWRIMSHGSGWENESSNPDNVWVVGMSQSNLGEPWRVQMNEDIRQAAARYDELRVVFKDAQNDSLKQKSQILEFIRAGVDLIIVSPNEAAPLTPPIAEAYRAGIPVIVLDRRVLGNEYTQFIGADNRLIGRAAGRWIAEMVQKLPEVKAGGEAKLVELQGLMTSTPGQDRHTGFIEGIAGSPVEIVFHADMKWLEPEARKEMESALAVYPQLNVVYAHNDPGAHGAWLAAKAADRDENILFVGIDGLPQEGQMYVRQGILAATFEYPTGGHEAVASAIKLLRGEVLTKEVKLRSRVFTPENIATGGEWLQGDIP